MTTERQKGWWDWGPKEWNRWFTQGPIGRDIRGTWGSFQQGRVPLPWSPVTFGETAQPKRLQEPLLPSGMGLGAPPREPSPSDPLKGAMLVAPGLLQLMDGTYWDLEANKPVSPEMAERILADFYGTDKPEELEQGITAFQQSQLDIQPEQIKL